MKLNDTRPNIETSGELEEQFFSIEDQGMIFDILRNKMYSNPILAIAREISCNARDAHREVGTPEKPINIYLPNRLESFYKIKDFGPGISPDRMSNIFIKYTASTKRKDNIQTGGFGLGAKTPFSYSDTFTILTNVNGVQYNYACFIDETKVGKLALLSEAPTTEPNGTEIIIPVKPADYRSFAEWTEHATRHWDVKPVVKGGEIEYKKIEKIIDGQGWCIASTGHWNREVKLVIDGIEYPLELSALKTYADSKMIDSSRGNIYLYFGVGELSLSASREQVYLDKQTQNKIKDRLDSMAAEIRQNVSTKIDAFPNLWDANVYYRGELTNVFSNIAFLGQLHWKGIPLSQSAITVGCPTFSFSKGRYSRKHGHDPNKLSRSNTGNRISFDASSVLFVNDLTIKEPTPRHVKKAFEDNPNLQAIQIICFTDKVTEAQLNQSIHLDMMKPRRLSEITKASGRAYTPASSRLLVFKFEQGACAFRQTSYANLEEDTNEKVLVTLIKDSYNNSRHAILKSGKSFSETSMSALAREYPDVSFYGLDSTAPKDRVEEDFADFTALDNFLLDKIPQSKRSDFVEMKFASHKVHEVDDRQLKYYNKFKSLIVNPNSIFMKRLNLHNKIKTLSANYSLLSMFEDIHGHIGDQDYKVYLAKHPEHDIEKMNEEYMKKYPLMEYMNSYYSYERIVEPLVQYVNLMDTI